MLKLHGVGKDFANAVTALTGVNLTINERDFLVLLGPSGCGKSTLLRLIAGLEQPSAGSMTWQSDPPAAGEIGFVFQEPTLMPWATALQNVALPRRLRGDLDAAEKARAALKQVGLSGFEAARPGTLSGGMRMRVSIARALVSRPRLLLMDEPFAALDEFTRHRLQDECLALTAELGCTTVFVTHSLYEATYLANRIILMTPRPGRIVADIAEPGLAAPDRLSRAYQDRVARLTRSVQLLHLHA